MSVHLRQIGVAVSIALVVPGCVGRVRPITVNTVVPRESGGETATASVPPEAAVRRLRILVFLSAANEACERRSSEIETQLARASDDDARGKLISGLITAGVSGIFGTVAGVADATDSPMMSAGGMVGSESNAPVWFGVLSGIAALGGGIVTGVLQPGVAETAQLERDLAEANEDLGEIEHRIAVSGISGLSQAEADSLVVTAQRAITRCGGEYPDDPEIDLGLPQIPTPPTVSQPVHPQHAEEGLQQVDVVAEDVEEVIVEENQ